MPYEMKPNTASLFKNDKRLTDNHPNATGKALIDGVEYWVSAWTKDGQKGKWQSLAFTPVEQRVAPQERAQQPERVPTRSLPSPRQASVAQGAVPRTSHGFEDMDDDIPPF